MNSDTPSVCPTTSGTMRTLCHMGEEFEELYLRAMPIIWQFIRTSIQMSQLKETQSAALGNLTME